MKNLSLQSIFHVENTQLNQSSLLTTFKKKTALAIQDSIQSAQGTLVAVYNYQENGTYQLVYCQVDHNGNEQTFIEDEGILPTLFLSPSQQNFVSIIPYHPDKEMEISIPLFQREHIELPKSNRPFLGDFIGTTTQYSIFFHSDIWSETRPDKLLVMDFKNGAVNKKKNIKIELPRSNTITVENDEIHLLASEGQHWIHRQIDVAGNAIQQRNIQPSQKNFLQILSLSFIHDSYVLCRNRTHLFIEKITAENSCERIELIEFNDPIYNTWNAVKIAEQTYIIQFNTEFGNGWITLKNGQLFELFYSKGVQGYKNLLNGEVLKIEHDHIILSSVNKTVENAYAVVMYPQMNQPATATHFWVLNRNLNQI